MSVIESVKSALGLAADRPTYECVDCGSTFESGTEPGTHWFRCRNCGSEAPLGDDQT